MKSSQEQYLAVAFLLGSNHYRYGKLIENLESDYTQGQDKYLKTVTAAYGLLTNGKQDARNIMRILEPGNHDGVAFANIDCNDNNDHALNTNGWKSKKEWLKDRVNITCHKCGDKGHYANECKGKKIEKEVEATLVTTTGSAIDNFDEEVDHVCFNSYSMRTTGVSSSTK
jgi:hypothetical protein